VNAKERFIEYAMTRAKLSREEAERVLAVYKKEKLVKFDGVAGSWSFKHGVFGEPDVLRRAAGR